MGVVSVVDEVVVDLVYWVVLVVAILALKEIGELLLEGVGEGRLVLVGRAVELPQLLLVVLAPDVQLVPVLVFALLFAYFTVVFELAEAASEAFELHF